MASILDIIAGPVMQIINKVIPDPAAKAAAQLQVLQMQQNGEFKELEADLQMAKAQTDLDLEQAKSSSKFASWPRPAMMWCCVFIFGSNYIAVPLLAWLSPLIHIPPPPRLDIGEVLPVLMGMLGLGAYRTTEKLKGVA